MERREFLIGATSSVAAMAFANASAASTHAGHGHGGGDPKVHALRESTLACQQAAADCIRHCIEKLGGGDGSLARAQSKVLDFDAIFQSDKGTASVRRRCLGSHRLKFLWFDV